jgi:hypothetical protein
MHPVAGLGRLPVADIVRQDDEIAAVVKQLARPEQLAGELRTDEIMPRAALVMRPEASRAGVPSVV